MSIYSYKGSNRMWTPRLEQTNNNINADYAARNNNHSSKLQKFMYTAAAENNAEKWQVSQSMRLLRLYGAHRCLWDVYEADYRSRELRNTAWIDIAAAMGNGMTKSQALQKINVLRATYRYEKKRIKQRIRKGIGAKTKLKWYALADAFLRKLPKSTKAVKSNHYDSDTDLENTMVVTIDPEVFIPETNDSYEVQDKSIAQHKQFSDDDDNRMETVYQQFSTENNNNVHMEYKIWTAVESLQLVKLLIEFPKLWLCEDDNNTTDISAIDYISSVMNISFQRIEKRINIFKRTYHTELMKMSKNSTYKPAYVWWPLVEKYVNSLTVSQTATNSTATQFVAVKDNINASTALDVPLQIHKSVNLLSAENMQYSANSSPKSIASTAELNNSHNSPLNLKINNFETKVVTAQAQLYSKPNVESNSTKLIYNGLEDDLLEGKWSLKHSVKFLRLYGAHRLLWDLNHPDYRLRELRTAAMEDIAAAMGHGLTAQYVAKKIKIFRITYMQHRKRILEDIKQGKEPDLQLRWFPLADSFLRPHIGLRSIKDQNAEMPQFDFEYVYTNLNLIDPTLLTDFNGKGTQNAIEIGANTKIEL